MEWLKALLNKVVDKVKGAFGKKEEKQKEAKGGKLDDTEVGKVIHFKADGESHKIWIAVKGAGNIEVMVASDESPVERLLLKWECMSKATKKDKENINKALTLYKEIMTAAKEAQYKLADAQKTKDEKSAQTAGKADEVVESKEDQLAKVMEELFKKFGNKDEIDPAIIAEAHGKFQAITDKANSFVGGSLANLYPDYLSKKQIDAAKDKLKTEGPWMYWVNYGIAVENKADELVKGTEFKSLKGGNQPDFVGKDGTKFERLVIDITTDNQNTINAHIGRTTHKDKAAKYKNVIITTYKRIGSQKQIISEMDKNSIIR